MAGLLFFEFIYNVRHCVRGANFYEKKRRPIMKIKIHEFVVSGALKSNYAKNDPRVLEEERRRILPHSCGS